MPFVINLAVLGAVISQIAFPGATVVATSTDVANLSQNLIAQSDTLTQGPDQPQPAVVADPGTPDKVITNAVITAYTSTPGQTDDTPFIAASGKHVHDGMIAANGLPFGTKVKIPSVYGDKIFVVEDRMNSRYGYGRFDVWLDMSRAEARKFGVKRVAVEIFYPDTNIAKK